MLGKLDAIVLAFQRTNAVKAGNMNIFSVFIPVHGKPMLEWIIETLRGSYHIGEVSLIGSDALDSLPCMRFIDRRLSIATV